MQKINTVIIEDDDSSISNLELLIDTYTSNLAVKGIAKTMSEGLTLINTVKPDLIFLDINLPDGNGFDLLNNTIVNNFKVIFTTVYDKYAVRAFEISALHYLLKPVTAEKLIEAVKRYPAETKDSFEDKITILKESLIEKPRKIMLPTSDGLELFNIGDIIRCEADGNYTNVFFNNKKQIMISKPLKSLEENLKELDFSRIHHGNLINLKYLKKYVKGKKPYVVMTDNNTYSISESRRKAFTDELEQFATQLN